MTSTLVVHKSACLHILSNSTVFPGSLPGNHVCYCLFAHYKSIVLGFVGPVLAENTQVKGKLTIVTGNKRKE